ncbi:MAG TPA: hypothetical protein VL993_18515, partial [Stellaceae bacterium]|nr:hypothetical protein [Stellaceae bacterium]
MRRVLPILSALLLACVAGAPCAWAQAEDPPAPDTSSLVLPAPDAATVAAVVAANPGAALPLVASAVARDPAIAPDLVAKVIAALSGRNDADEAGRIAAAASSIAPALAPRIVGAAVGAASLAAGRAVKPYPGTTPSDAAQAALAASATAAATVAQAVIAAIGETTDAHVTADAAAAITREAVAASMTATATAASEAARAAGATPGEATALGAKAARLAAEMVTQAIIAAATTATQKAAASDASALAARTNASPEAAAATAAAAASLVADRVTRAAVAASGSAESASGVADAAQRQTSRSVSAVATTAASSAGASPEAAQRIGDRAGARSDGAADGVAGPALARPGGAPALGTETLSLSPASPADIARGSGSLLDHPERAVPAIFAMLAFVTVVGLALPWLQPDIFKSRLKLINERRGALSQQRKQRLEAERHSLRRLTSGREDFMRVVLEKLKVKNITEQPELRKKLVRAGYRSPQAAITLTFLRLALPLALAGVLALLLFG